MTSDNTATRMDEARAPRRIDWISAGMALGTVLIVAGTAWLRFGPSPAPVPPSVGALLPPLRVFDMESAQPVTLRNPRGKLLWIAFWAPVPAIPRDPLPRLEKVRRQFRSYRSLELCAVAVVQRSPAEIQATADAAGATIPIFLASPEVEELFSPAPGGPPLHVLVDGDGKIAALARGDGEETYGRLTKQVRDWLDAMDPLRNTRFARLLSPVGRGCSEQESSPRYPCTMAMLALATLPKTR